MSVRQNLSLRQQVVGGVERVRTLRDAFCPAGRFVVQHIRAGKMLAEYKIPNGIVDVGLTHILETQFHAGSQITTWYIGLVDNSGFSAFDDTDTMASHAGWAECSDYDEATRPEWAPDAADDREISNSVTADFTISATKTIKGLFITSGSAKGGTVGTLWSTAAFASTIPVGDDDVLKVTYTLSG